MAEIVRAATYRADALIAGLLVLARTESGVAGATIPVDLAELIGPALSAVRGEARERNLSVAVSGGPAPVSGDPALLERVVGNLVENAVRHNVHGGWVEIHTGVRSGAAPVGGSELRVASSGTPVPADRGDELFEPFRRGADRATSGGSGLGLSIVRAVVVAHRGTVHAEPVKGGGLVVTVQLPRRHTDGSPVIPSVTADLGG
jgi:hypothetical protein